VILDLLTLIARLLCLGVLGVLVYLSLLRPLWHLHLRRVDVVRRNAYRHAAPTGRPRRCTHRCREAHTFRAPCELA
jgi:hypothetical protein